MSIPVSGGGKGVPNFSVKGDQPYIPSPSVEGDTWYTLLCDEKKLGLKFSGVEITTVTEGTWAAKNMVEVDDEIVEIDGIEFGSLSRPERVTALQSNRPISIKFKRPIIKDAYFTVELHETKLGMGFKNARVSNVTPTGWASRSGVLVNDEIVEVNGIGFTGLSDEDKINQFRKPRPIDIRFKRPAKTQRGQALRGESVSLPGSTETAFIPIIKSKEIAIPEPRTVRTAEDSSEASPKPVEKISRDGFFSCCTNTTDASNDVVITRCG